MLTTAHVKVSVKFDAARDRWVVAYLLPTGVPGTYDRKRLFFRTETPANDEAARVRRQHQNVGAHGLAYDPVRWRRYLALEELLGTTGSIELAVQHFIKSPPPAASLPLQDVVAAFLDDKEGHVSRPWHRTLVRYMMRFVRKHPAAEVDKVTVDQIKSFMASQGGKETQGHIRRMMWEMYTWAVTTNRASKNPVTEIRAPRIIRDTPATITVDNLDLLLRTAWKENSKLVPYIALRVFGGMRSALVLRLRWDMIEFGQSIRIPAAIDKGERTTNRVDWPPALWKWLKPFKAPSGRMAKTGYPAEMCELAIKCGFRIGRSHLRHTFGSSMLNSSGDISRTQLLMGHRGAPDVLLEHYDGNVSGKEAKRLFALLPPTIPPTTCRPTVV